MASTTTVNEETQNGYIYCISANPLFQQPFYKSRPCVFHIGWTTEDPMMVVEEMKSGIDGEFLLKLSKKVSSPELKGEMIHNALSSYKIYSTYESFYCKISQIEKVFASVDGEWVVEPSPKPIKPVMLKTPTLVTRTMMTQEQDTPKRVTRSKNLKK
jgi:hypothetical protein